MMTCNVKCGAVPLKVPPADAFIPYVNRAETAAENAEESAQTAQEAQQKAEELLTQIGNVETDVKKAQEASQQAQEYATQAQESSTNAQQSADTATQQAQTATEQAEISSANAEQTKQNADKAQTNAGLSEAWAQSSESPDGETDDSSPTTKTQSSKSWALYAKGQAETATQQAESAINSQQQAQGNATNAQQYANQAQNSQEQAKNSENNAEQYATNAQQYANQSQASAEQAGNSANISEAWAQSSESPDGEADDDSTTQKTQSSRTWALYSKSQAQSSVQSATNASGSMVQAQEYATQAQESATNAKTYETNAQQSADIATQQAQNSENSATMANDSMKQAQEYAQQAEYSSQNVNVFIPSVSDAGVISWTNKAGLENPKNVNIMGPQGVAGEITEATATINNSVGVPNVDLVLGGTSSQRTLQFNFSNLKGDTGEQGPKGEKGDTGEQGAGLQVKGKYDNLDDLQQAHPTATVGDAYMVGNDVYIWTYNNTWENFGALQGPQGPQGIQGPQGEAGIAGSITNATATIDNNIGIPNVQLELGGTPNQRTFSFSFHNLKGEQGEQGERGEQGPQGIQGPKGDTGEQGPRGEKGDTGEAGSNGTAATITIGDVNTGEAGSNVIITNSGNNTNAVLNFTIPRGDTGAQGPAGQNGQNATIQDVTASVDNNTGTPSVDVTMGGTNQNRTFNFAFHNLKGEQGEVDTSNLVTIDGKQVITGQKQFSGNLLIPDGSVFQASGSVYLPATSKVTSWGGSTVDLSASSYVSVPDPIKQNDAATKQYVDNSVANIDTSNLVEKSYLDNAGIVSGTTTNGIAIGQDSTSQNTRSVALGISAEASGFDGVAIGSYARATQTNSVAIGNQSTAYEENSVSVGSATLTRRITNVEYPINPNDAATKQYVDNNTSKVDTSNLAKLDQSNTFSGNNLFSGITTFNNTATFNNNVQIMSEPTNDNNPISKQYFVKNTPLWKDNMSSKTLVYQESISGTRTINLNDSMENYKFIVIFIAYSDTNYIYSFQPYELMNVKLNALSIDGNDPVINIGGNVTYNFKLHLNNFTFESVKITFPISSSIKIVGFN